MISLEDARARLASWGAPRRLKQHVVLVGEAGESLLQMLRDLQVDCDASLVRAGIVFHDAGKIRHPLELEIPGHQHEAAGEEMLLEAGLPPELARICRSHSQWEAIGASFEELLVALADQLWKGKRNAALEKRVTEEIARRSESDFWDVFMPIDGSFERIAASADERLARTHDEPMP